MFDPLGSSKLSIVPGKYSTSPESNIKTHKQEQHFKQFDADKNFLFLVTHETQDKKQIELSNFQRSSFLS